MWWVRTAAGGLGVLLLLIVWLLAAPTARAATVIDYQLVKGTVVYGKQVELRGTVVPAAADQQVAIVLNGADIATAVTAADGSFSYSFTPKAGGVVAEVDQETCAACLTCVRICPYEVPRIDPEAKKAYIEPAACQGCGVCVSECPAKAIELHHYSDSQIIAKEEALFLTEADIAAGVALDASTPFPKSDAGQPSGEVS